MQPLTKLMKDKKRILFYQHVSMVGGSSWCLLEIIQELDRGRYDPTVVLRTYGPLVDELERLSVPVFYQDNMGIIHQEYSSKFPYYQFQFFKDVLNLKNAVDATRKLCKELRPDLVYLNSAVLFPLARGVKLAGASKVLLHIREHWSGHPKSLKNIYKNYICKKYVDGFLSISQTGAACFGFESRTELMRDWVDFSTRSDSAAEGQLLNKYGVDWGKPYFLVPGGDSPVKGTVNAIRAFHKLRNTDVQLVVLGLRERRISKPKSLILRILSVVGFVPTWYVIEKLSKQDSRIVRVPHVQGIKPFLEKTIANVSPFRMPHCAKSALEAGMLGRPSILTEGGEAHEYVVHEKTGFVVPQHNVDLLADTMMLLLNAPDKASRMGAEARVYVGDKFSAKKSMEVLRDAIEKLIR